MVKYQEIAEYFIQSIENKLLKAGDKLPSIRSVCKTNNVSKTTVIAAYSLLEAKGLILSKARSGFFVSPLQPLPSQFKTPSMSNPIIEPVNISTEAVITKIMESGAAFDFLPEQSRSEGNTVLVKYLTKAQRQQGKQEQHYYDDPSGALRLRTQLVKRVNHSVFDISPDEIVVTQGCQNSLMLALLATTQPGDTVAIESPSYHGVIQLLEALKLKAIELPSSPVSGIDLEAFEQAINQWNISAAILSPNFSTPTGSSMPRPSKKRLLEICVRHDMLIIEDDIYSELFFGLTKPESLFSLDTHGIVILCSSFSKSLSRDLRIGWILPGKYINKVKRYKIATILAMSSTQQLGLALYLEQGKFDGFLNKRRRELENQSMQLLSAIKKYLPSAIHVSSPRGGLTLWVELAENINTIEIYHQALQYGITLTPGRMFSSQKKYDNFLRLSFSEPLTEERCQALAQVESILSKSL